MGHDPKSYPLDRILAAAELASSLTPGVTPQLLQAMQDPDSAVRYWGVMGLLMRGEKEVAAAHTPLVNALDDPAPSVQIAAAEALGRYGTPAGLDKVLRLLIQLANPVVNGAYVSMQALNAIEVLGPKAAPLFAQVKALPQADPNAPERVRTEYIKRLIDQILSQPARPTA